MRKPHGARGFSLIEVAVTTLILVIGLVGLLAVFSQAIVAINFSQEDLIAKQKARETLESIYTARDTQQITFDVIQNIPQGGIFLSGPQPLSQAGADGLVGTADDTAVEFLRLPGPDGLLGTADDQIRVLTNFTRQIQIDPIVVNGVVNTDIRRLTVTIGYVSTRGWKRTYEVQSYISRFR